MPKLGNVVLNTVYSEQKGASVKTTDKPIENGMQITDHVQIEQTKLSISGVCAGADAAKRMLILETNKNNGNRLSYYGRYALKNVIIESIQTTKDDEAGGNGYKFNIQLKQIIVVETKTYKQNKTKPKTTAGKRQPTTKTSSKRTYIVVPRDSLWKIAQKFYGSKKGYLYTLIYNANKKVIGNNPRLIRPGQKLIIP